MVIWKQGVVELSLVLMSVILSLFPLQLISRHIVVNKQTELNPRKYTRTNFTLSCQQKYCKYRLVLLCFKEVEPCPKKVNEGGYLMKIITKIFNGGVL